MELEYGAFTGFQRVSINGELVGYIEHNSSGWYCKPILKSPKGPFKTKIEAQNKLRKELKDV